MDTSAWQGYRSVAHICVHVKTFCMALVHTQESKGGTSRRPLRRLCTPQAVAAARRTPAARLLAPARSKWSLTYSKTFAQTVMMQGIISDQTLHRR